MPWPWILLGVFVFFSYTTEAIAGFGSIVIAVGLGALILPIDEMLPVLVPLNLISSTYFTVKYRRHIHWRTLGILILPWMALGAVAGNFLKPYLGNDLLKSLFGLLVLWFALRELWKMHRGTALRQNPRPRTLTQGIVGAAGITHGLFASGGPLLVYALAGQPLDKITMRSTLIVVWLTLNTLLTILYILDGSLVPSLHHTLAFVPIVLAAMLTGEFLHNRINETQFRRTVFVVLAVTGLFLAIPKPSHEPPTESHTQQMPSSQRHSIPSRSRNVAV